MLLVDLLGSGFSDRPEDFGYSVEDHADMLGTLIKGLSMPSVDLVGHSMGGSIAIVVATRNPGKVRRLVVSEPNLDAGGGVFSRPIAQQSEADYIGRGHKESVQNAVAEGQTIWSGSLLMSSPLEALTIPRTVIFGSKSLPDPDTERLSKVSITVRVVQDAGHSMIWENPSGYAEAVRASLF